MFIIPVVASSSISSVSFVDAFFFLKDMSSGLTTILYMIFCYKFYYDFFMKCKLYVKFVLIHLYIFSYVKMVFNIYFLCEGTGWVGGIVLCLFPDNSGSPSIVEQ